MRTFLVCDSGGLYTSLCERLAKEPDTHVLYFCDFKSYHAYPESYKRNLGQGIPNVTRLDNFEDGKYIADVIVFPDVQQSAFAQDLKDNGFRVWGSCNTGELENNRKLFKDKIEEWGLPIGEYAVVKGIDNLLGYLDKQKDIETNPKFVKVSESRGDMETHKVDDKFNYHSFFEKQKFQMGLNGRTRDFIIESMLEGQEYGIDSYVVNGKFPLTICAGYELKDVGYAGLMMLEADLPKGMRLINEKLQFHTQEVSTFLSTEVRVAKGKHYFTDPTMRAPCPPIECMYANYENLVDIIYNGANDVLVEPIFKKKYVCQIILKSSESTDRDLRIRFDQKYKDNIFFYNYYVENGDYFTVPIGVAGHDIVCSVVGLGDNFQEAMEMCLEIAKTIKTDGICFNEHCFDELDKTIAEGESNGIEIFS